MGQDVGHGGSFKLVGFIHWKASVLLLRLELVTLCGLLSSGRRNRWQGLTFTQGSPLSTLAPAMAFLSALALLPLLVSEPR